MAALSEDEQLHLALALSASEAATPLAPPAVITGPKLRQLSETQKWGGPRRVGPNTRSDQNKCHRIENATLVRAYNSTTDDTIKLEIIKLNMSKDNAFHGENNSSHTAMEQAFRGGTANSEQYNRKADMLLTAISNLDYYKDDYSEKTVVHILKTLKAESPTYNEVVARLDKRSFHTPDIKDVIDEARNSVAEQEAADRSFALALDLQEKERRSEAATKGWETRRRNETAERQRSEAVAEQEAADRSMALALDLQEKERRSAVAKKGWETRRRNKEAAADRRRPETGGTAISRAAQAQAEATALHQRRSEAALRGWETRRQNQMVAAGFAGQNQVPHGFTGSSHYAFSGFTGGPTKSDGTPDMRFKANRL